MTIKKKIYSCKYRVKTSEREGLFVKRDIEHEYEFETGELVLAVSSNHAKQKFERPTFLPEWVEYMLGLRNTKYTLLELEPIDIKEETQYNIIQIMNKMKAEDFLEYLKENQIGAIPLGVDK